MAKKGTKKSPKKKKRSVSTATTHFVGVLHTGSSNNFSQLVEFMRREALAYLQTHGSPNDSIVIYNGGHYANDDIGQLRDDATTLVNDTTVKPIVAAGGPQSAIAAMDATVLANSNARKTVPIVFTTVADPFGLGLVDSLKTPGRNLTGMAGQTSEMDPKRLEALHAFVWPQRPSQPRKVGVLINPGRPDYPKHYATLQQKAQSLNLQLVPKHANSEMGIKRAFRAFRDKSFLGVVVSADSFFNNNRATVIAEAAREDGIPAIYQWTAFAEDGGLISFGPSIKEAYLKAGTYVGRILKGENPAKMECSKPVAPFEIFVTQTTATNVDLPNVPPTITVGGVVYPVNVNS